MTLPFPVAYRERVPSDDAFIVTTWLESLHKGSHAMARLRFSRYKRLLVPVLAQLIQSGDVRIAALPDDTDHILGWACGTDALGTRALQYVYVRPDRRRVGLGEALARLVADQGSEYAWATTPGQSIARRLDLSYNPLCAMVTR